MSIRMISWTTIKEADGNQRRVQVGDKVRLAPTDRKLGVHDDSKDGFITPWTASFLRECIGGKGPYIIKQIGQWPCGGVYLYVSHKKRLKGGFGANKKNFIPYSK